MGIGIFCTENWSNLVHALKVCSNGHLFGELWRLCQISIALEWRSDWNTNLQNPGSPTFEIADFEDRCTRLGGRTLQLGTVDLYEAL